MFKILVIEDNTEKLRSIYQALENIKGVSIEDVDHEIDATSAKKRLKEICYDLIIVDIAIPLNKSTPIDIKGGIKLVEEILQRAIYNTPAHIIGLTAHNEIFEEAKTAFNSQILSVIRYSDTDNEWERLLSNGISQWISSKTSSTNAKPNYNYDVAIITAVDIEFKAVKNLSSTWDRVVVPNDSTMYLETILNHEDKKIRVIAASLSQMGMNASAVLSMKIIHNFRPKYLFMPGIAASIKDSFSHGFGDILVIDECWDGGAGKITQDVEGKYCFQPVALHIRLETDLSEKMRVLKDNSTLLRDIKDKFTAGSLPNTELAIHIGSVVSVAGVIANSEITNELTQKDRKLLGLEMEAYGMYYSANNCSHPKPVVMALKSVCDFANNSKNDDFQSYAAYTSAQVLYHFIIKECTY